MTRFRGGRYVHSLHCPACCPLSSVVLSFSSRVLIYFGGCSVVVVCVLAQELPPVNRLNDFTTTSLVCFLEETLILTRDRRNDVCRPMTPTFTLPSQFPCHECCTASQPSGSLLQVCLVACRKHKASVHAAVLGRASRSATGCVILGHLHHQSTNVHEYACVPAKRPHRRVLMTSFLSTGLRRPHRALI